MSRSHQPGFRHQALRFTVCNVSAPLLMPASAARLSICSLQWQQETPCSGGTWTWVFQHCGTEQREPYPLCSEHELLQCRCPKCQTPISPDAVLCLWCMVAEYEGLPSGV
jgi:hypothetical protein